MVEPMTFILQLSSCRDRVWVHASDGSTVGRFSVRGIDIHHSLADQEATGKQCLHCTHRPSTADDWDFFRAHAQAAWGLTIPEDAFRADLLLPRAA